jgi:hypothetical protein
MRWQNPPFLYHLIASYPALAGDATRIFFSSFVAVQLQQLPLAVDGILDA